MQQQLVEHIRYKHIEDSLSLYPLNIVCQSAVAWQHVIIIITITTTKRHTDKKGRKYADDEQYHCACLGLFR